MRTPLADADGSLEGIVAAAVGLLFIGSASSFGLVLGAIVTVAIALPVLGVATVAFVATGHLSLSEDSRLLRSVVLAGVAVALAAVFFGGLVAVGPLQGVLFLVAVALPVIGLGMASFTLWVARQQPTDPKPTIDTDRTQWGYVDVDHPAESALETAETGQYRCYVNSSAREVRSRLRRGAVRVIKTRYGLADADAREAVAEGTWTDDPIAAAFLAEEPTYPLYDRLRAAVEPGRAYRRRVRRTLDEVDSLDPRIAGCDGRAEKTDPLAGPGGPTEIDGTGPVAATGDDRTVADQRGGSR